jgi:hypothetical protein
MQALFTEQVWLGGFYELAMEYEPWSEASLDEALRALWHFPDLEGCYPRPDIEPSEQQQITPSAARLEANGHLRGIATLPDGKKVACGTYLVREDLGPAWLGLYLPMGALATAYDVGAFPFTYDGASRTWREPLESWLAIIGESVYSQIGFRLGLVGFEVSGTMSANDLVVSGIPEKRSIGYLYPADNHLSWYPTNQWHQTPQLAS